MADLPSPRQTGESPFWELLAEAEEVQIREFDAAVPVQKETGSKLDDWLADFASTHQEGRHRAFVVRVKTPSGIPVHPPVPKPEKSALRPKPTDDETVSLPDREHLLNSAALLVESGDHVLARHLYSYLLKNDDADIDALRGLGVCLFRLGDKTSAKKLLQASYDKNPSDQGRYWLGQVTAADGEVLNAIALFESVGDVTSLKPAERFQLHKEWGNCLARLERFEEAKAQYHKALAEEPASDSVLGNLGTVELESGDLECALSHFQAALEINPANSRARCGLGLIALSKRDFEGAARELQHAADIDPRNPDFPYALAVVELERGEWGACMARLKAVLEKFPDFEKAKRLLLEIQRVAARG